MRAARCARLDDGERRQQFVAESAAIVHVGEAGERLKDDVEPGKPPKSVSRPRSPGSPGYRRRMSLGSVEPGFRTAPAHGRARSGRRDRGREIVADRAGELGLRLGDRDDPRVEGDAGEGAVEGRADPLLRGERPKPGNEFAEARLMRAGGGGGACWKRGAGQPSATKAAPSKARLAPRRDRRSIRTSWSSFQKTAPKSAKSNGSPDELEQRVLRWIRGRPFCHSRARQSPAPRESLSGCRFRGAPS